MVHHDSLVLKTGSVHGKGQSHNRSMGNISLSSTNVGCHDRDVPNDNARQSGIDKEKEHVREDEDVLSSSFLIEICKMFQLQNKCIDTKFKSFDEVID